jgi:prepilin signal peptidase PulO-like enzyme (type II secretory pathway)
MLGPDSVSRLILILAAAAVGASVGSFLNVCIYRIPIGLTVNQPRRSFCPACGHLVEARDNIPVLSWLWLRGRCRYCKALISIWYFLVELLCGIGTAFAFATDGFVYAASFLFLFSLLCIGIRTRHSDYQPGALFLVLLMSAITLVLKERDTTPWTAPVPLLISILGGFIIGWFFIGRKNWKQTLVVICAAVTCGSFIAIVLAVLAVLGSRFKDWSERFPGLDDALLLMGVCTGVIIGF